MATKPEIRPSDLPTKIVRSPSGSVVRMKVVQSESPTLPYDLLAAFRSGVSRIRRDRRNRERAASDAAQG